MHWYRLWALVQVVATQSLAVVQQSTQPYSQYSCFGKTDCRVKNDYHRLAQELSHVVKGRTWRNFLACGSLACRLWWVGEHAQ